jgi:hypothetical protein
MQVVNTPYTKFGASTSTWDAVESGLIEGGLIANYTPPVGEIISIPNPGTDPVITVPVSGQPRTVTVGGIEYQQVATNPSPGQYTYNALTNTISVSLQLLSSSPVTPDSNPIIIKENTIPIKYGYHGGERLLDYVPEEEIGLDFIAFLGSISSCGEGGIFLDMEFSKGGLPTVSVEIQLSDTSLDDALLILNDPNILYRKFVIYGISFYLNPFTIVDNELRTAITIQLNFESINSPRSQYNRLDRLTYIVPSNPTALVPETLTQLAENKGISVESPPIFVTTKSKDVYQQKTLRSAIESTATHFDGFVDYRQPSVKIIKNHDTPVLILPDDISILPEVTIEKNGIPGAGIVDGVLLSSPWIFRAWQPDSSGTILGEDVDTTPENSSDPFLSTLIGEPDTEPSNPTKKLVGNGYFYVDNSEAENFPLAAQNPSALSYPTGFSKASWQESTVSGFKLSQLNGKRYGWEVLSTQVWSFIDPPLAGKPGIKFSLEPIWAFTPPVATAHWKQVQTWNLTAGFDDEGYSITENETGKKRMQARSESDQRTAAQLNYDSKKLKYEADALALEAASLTGDDKLAKEAEAADKKKLSEEKEREITLYEYHDIPYTKTVRRYYQRLSAVKSEIRDDERPAKFLQREISTESGFIFVPNPVLGEPPIMIGESKESTYDVIAAAGGYEIVQSSRTVNQQGDSAKETTRQYVQGTPPPAPRSPQRWGKDAPQPPPPETEPGFAYYSTPAGSQSVGFFEASREAVSVQGLVNSLMAPFALLGICREENLDSETTSLDTLWFREIAPGDRAWFRGRLWQCTQIARRDRIQIARRDDTESSILIQCLSFSSQWGSWLESLAITASSAPPNVFVTGVN